MSVVSGHQPMSVSYIERVTSIRHCFPLNKYVCTWHTPLISSVSITTPPSFDYLLRHPLVS